MDVEEGTGRVVEVFPHPSRLAWIFTQFSGSSLLFHESTFLSMTVRSAVLGKYQVPAATPQVVALCPDGMTLLVKEILFQNNDVVAGSGTFRLYPPSGIFYVDILTETVAIGQYVAHTCWVVLSPGDFVYYVNGLSIMSVWVSGTVLYGTAQGYTQYPQATTLPANPFPLPTG